jgi:hypothetical protein
MLIFDRIWIDCYNLDYIVVNWAIKPTNEDISLYSFGVWRSDSPDGNFSEVYSGLTNVFSYKDTSVNLYSKWRKFFYKVRCSLSSDPTQYVDSLVESNATKPDPIAVEIIRRNDLVLKNFVGVPAIIYIRRTWGQHCPNCWDSIKQRKTQSNCAVCYNTGYVGGFFDPISVNINFNPSPELIRHAQFELQVDTTTAWMSNFPPVSPKDIIIENGKKRWRVVQTNQTQKKRLLVHQVFSLTQVNLNDIEYKLPIPGAE